MVEGLVHHADRQMWCGSAGDEELLDSLMRESEQLGSIPAAEALIGECFDGINGLLVRSRVGALGRAASTDDFVSDSCERGRELVADHQEGQF